MQEINYAENRNVYMPSCKMKRKLKKIYKYVHQYPDYKNIENNLIAAKYFNINVENLTVTNGSLEAINLLVNVLGKKKASLFQPTFWGYEDALKRYNYEITNHSLDGNLNYNLSKMKKAAKNSEVMILCNPNNPTLSLLPKEELLELIDSNLKCHFIIDETMLIFDEEIFNKTMIDEVNGRDNLSVVVSFSKFLGVAGLRTGCAISNSKIIEKLKCQSVPYSFGIVPQKVLPIALSNPKYLNNTRRRMCRNRKYLCEGFRKIGCLVINGNTNFILIKLPDGIDANSVTDYLNEHHMIVRNIKEAYPLLEGDWLRISLQKPKYNRLLLKRIKTKIDNKN